MAVRGFVVVSGPPASGKSSLAPLLATSLDLPLLAKDVIKDALVDALGAPDYAARSTGRGAGYFDLGRDPQELWNAEVGTPVAGGRPVLEVDTSAPADVDALTARIAAAR